MGRTYLAEVLSFAFRRTVTVTDGLSVIIGTVLPAALYLMGSPSMAKDLAGLAALAVVCVAALVALLRLVSAPYFIWKRQQARIAELERELSEPDRQLRAMMRQAEIEDRRQLVAQISQIADRVDEATAPEVSAAFSALYQLTQRFMIEPEFGPLWTRFVSACWRYAASKPRRESFATADDFSFADLRHSGEGYEPVRLAQRDLIRHLLLLD